MGNTLKHDLHYFLQDVIQRMALEYKRIYEKATQDPGTAGDQGEKNWAKILREWLPAGYHVVTKGRFINHAGEMSPQIDIVILKGSYPKRLAEEKIYLTAGVIAAFECKTTLVASHIHDAVKTAQKVKSLFRPRTGSAYKELHSPIVYGLLAHSHSWKNEHSKPIDNIERNLGQAEKSVTHPRELIDLLCVSDLCTLSLFKCAFTGPTNVPWNKELANANIWRERVCVHSIHNPFSLDGYPI